MEVIYVVYKDDEVVDIGTKEELSERMHVKKQTIAFYASPACHRRAGGGRMVAERVEVWD